jgi:hypothetical protein
VASGLGAAVERMASRPPAATAFNSGAPTRTRNGGTAGMGGFHHFTFLFTKAVGIGVARDIK